MERLLFVYLKKLKLKKKLMLSQDESHRRRYLPSAWLDSLPSYGQKWFVHGQMFRSSTPSQLENERVKKINMDIGTLEEAPHPFSGCIYQSILQSWAEEPY